MQSLIVTGGAGFIGSNFVRLALERGAERIVVVDKLTYAGHRQSLEDVLDDTRVELVVSDIAEPDAMERLFAEVSPTGVFNFAAETHVDRSIDGPSAFVRTNVVGTFSLLEAARRLFPSLSTEDQAAFRFVHVSTDEVYGSLGDEGAFSEATPYAPNSPYSASKAGADHLVRAYHETYGLPALVTNCSNNYGPYQFPEKLIPLVLLNAAEGKDIPIYGDGGNVRDWLYVEDHCDGIWAVFERGLPGRNYNIGGNCEKTNLELVDALLASLEEALPASGNEALRSRGLESYLDLKTFVQDRPGHDRRYAIDPTRIREELGWSPKHRFDEAMSQTVRWYLANRAWCRSVQTDTYDRSRLGLEK
ncbi:MAG: dTDP-glucose 4,6-dehydratase [Deltaproteobacteria bacterium]|nr:dTDP-glucose 4,6-dehydratase [Deltaproteobacteria bacterium]